MQRGISLCTRARVIGVSTVAPYIKFSCGSGSRGFTRVTVYAGEPHEVSPMTKLTAYLGGGLESGTGGIQATATYTVPTVQVCEATHE